MTDDPISKHKEEIEQLVILSQKGQADAFGKLYDLFITPIYRYMYYRVGTIDAEDLTELVFLKTWEHIRQYQRSKHSFSAWIFRIAHNIVVDFYRLNKDRAVSELSENIVDTKPESDSSARANRRINREILDECMRGLKDEYRQVLILKYMNNLNNEEIAVIMKRTQAGLRILQFRALRNLRKILEQHGITEFLE